MQVGQTYNPYRVFAGIHIPNWLVKHPGISATAKLAFGRLARYAGENGGCFPSLEEIASEIAVTRRQAIRAIDELVQARLIQKMQRTRETGGQSTNEYEFIWSEDCESESDRRAVKPAKKNGGQTPPPQYQNGMGGGDINVTGGGDINVTPLNHKVLRESEVRESNTSPGVLPPVPKACQPFALSESPKGTLQPPHVQFIDKFKATYEYHAGHPYEYKQAEFVQVAAKIKKFGLDAVEQKAAILAEMCQTRRTWFTRDGWADYTIAKLMSRWNEILPAGPTHKEIAAAAEKKKREEINARLNAYLD